MHGNSTLITDKNKSLRYERLIQEIARSKESRFYKNIWGAIYKKSGGGEFNPLPIITTQDIIKCKFSERSYIKNGLFVKVVYHKNIPYLIARTEENIGKENYGEIIYERPLVFFENSCESIEKGLWHYEKNILPHISEENLDITVMVAIRYEIDSVVGDIASIKKLFLPRLSPLAMSC